MKSKFLTILCAFCFVPFLFAGCDFLSGGKNSDLVEQKTQSTDEQQTTYYISNKYTLITEINGYYSTNRPFCLDKNDDNKRIYDDVYLYVDDMFYMDKSNSWDIYCTLSDPNDLEYVEIEKEDGVDIQINVLKQGIYKIVFDMSTMSFDLTYKSDILVPVYPEIQNCDIYSTKTKWIETEKQGDEFVAKNFAIEQGKFVSFFSHVHTSQFKTTVENGTENLYIKKPGTKPNSYVYFKVGGTYNIYINAKTYVVRVEKLD